MPGAILPIVGTPGEAEREDDEEDEGDEESNEGDEVEEEESLRPGLPLIGIGDAAEASGSSLSIPSLDAFFLSSAFFSRASRSWKRRMSVLTSRDQSFFSSSVANWMTYEKGGEPDLLVNSKALEISSESARSTRRALPRETVDL